MHLSYGLLFVCCMLYLCCVQFHKENQGGIVIVIQCWTYKKKKVTSSRFFSSTLNGNSSHGKSLEAILMKNKEIEGEWGKQSENWSETEMIGRDYWPKRNIERIIYL